MTDDEDMTIHRGSGCLWTDLGYDNATEMTVQAALANRVCVMLEERGWRPTAAAEATGLAAEVFLEAQRGRAGIGDLIEALTRLGSDILIVVGEPENERGAVLVRGPDDDE